MSFPMYFLKESFGKFHKNHQNFRNFTNFLELEKNKIPNRFQKKNWKDMDLIRSFLQLMSDTFQAIPHVFRGQHLENPKISSRFSQNVQLCQIPNLLQPMTPL